MKKILSIFIVFLICSVMLCGCGADGSVTVKGETFSLGDFYRIASDNTVKFNQYKGEEAVVTGEVTEIKDWWTSSNLGHTFSASVEIENKWVFEVSSSNSALQDLNIGDVITIKGEISTELYGVVYCYGNAIISK